MRGRIGNPKQKLRRDREKGNYIRVDTTTNNKDYFNQQHKQLDLTTIAPKTTHWALRDLLKTMVVNVRFLLKIARFTRNIKGCIH